MDIHTNMRLDMDLAPDLDIDIDIDPNVDIDIGAAGDILAKVSVNTYTRFNNHQQ